MGNAELKKFVERVWGVDGILSIERISGANINSKNFLLRAQKRRYVLKKVSSVSSRRLESMAQVLAFCKKRGIKVPQILATKKGNFVGKEGFLFFRFSEGKPFSSSTKEMYSLARELAYLHKVLAQCRVVHPAQRMNARLYKPLSLGELKRMKRISISPVVFEAAQFLSQNKPQSLKPQLIHGDLQPGNVLFERDKVSAILDFGGMYKENPWREVAFVSFRFALFLGHKKESLQKNVLDFANTYARARHLAAPSFEELKLHFLLETFARISYILRQKKEGGKSAWIADLGKQTRFLKLLYFKV